MKLSNLGEIKTIEYLRHLIEAFIKRNRKNQFVKVGIGDDAAVLKDGIVVSTDAYLEGVHFSLAYYDWYDVGQKVACATLSDIAAMAARPLAIFVSALLPPNINKTILKEIYSGILNITTQYDCLISGGDIVAHSSLGFILTVIGKGKQAKLRSMAKPGDLLYITGHCGLAETGRLVLKNNYRQRDYPFAIKRHLCPLPRIKETVMLSRYIHACIDTSDGLSTDAFHLASMSNVKIKIFAEQIPIHHETLKYHKKHCTAESLLDFVLNSGEDYEVLFTSRKELLPSAIGNTRLTKIGVIEHGHGVYLIRDNRMLKLTPQGYDHLKKS